MKRWFFKKALTHAIATKNLFRYGTLKSKILYVNKYKFSIYIFKFYPEPNWFNVPIIYKIRQK